MCVFEIEGLAGGGGGAKDFMAFPTPGRVLISKGLAFHFKKWLVASSSWACGSAQRELQTNSKCHQSRLLAYKAT